MDQPSKEPGLNGPTGPVKVQIHDLTKVFNDLFGGDLDPERVKRNQKELLSKLRDAGEIRIAGSLKASDVKNAELTVAFRNGDYQTALIAVCAMFRYVTSRVDQEFDSEKLDARDQMARARLIQEIGGYIAQQALKNEGG